MSARPDAQRASSTAAITHSRMSFRLAIAALMVLSIPLAQASTSVGVANVDAGTRYAAVFRGDATGRTNVTAALRSFLQSHNGQRVALAKDGIYKVTTVIFTAHDLTVDFRGARLQGSVVGNEVLQVQTSRNVVLNDARVYGTGYVWNVNTQWEHGIEISGGSDITLNRPRTRNTRGDGIYVGYSRGYNSPPVRIRINKPNVKRAARNGIGPVAGEVTITGGRIAHTGLHSIDFEVNDATGAGSIRAVVRGVDIRTHGDLSGTRAWCTCYAVAAEGSTAATKPSITVSDLTGDDLNMSIERTGTVVVRDNVSASPTIARFPNSSSVTFTGNTRISRR